MSASLRSVLRLNLRAGPLVVGLLFGLLAWIGIELTRDSGRIAALWLPNALLVAAILRLNWRRARFYVAACFIANLAVRLITGETVLLSLVFSLANILETLLVYGGVTQVAGRRPDLSEYRPLRAFCLIGGLVAPALSGTLAAATASPLTLASYGDAWLSWALAHSIGMLIAAPLLISVTRWVRLRRIDAMLGTPRDWLSIIGLGAAGTVLVFWQDSYPFLFMSSLFVLYAAFRLGTPGAAASTAVVALVASIATSLDTGPVHLVQGDIREKIMVLQTFLLFTFAGALPVAAAIAKRQRLENDLKESRDFAQSILDNMNELVFRTDAQGRWTFLNPVWEKLTGYPVEDALGKPTTTWLVPQDYEETKRLYPPLVAGEIEVLRLKQNFLRADGQIRRVETSVRALRDADGRFIGTTGNLRDVTEEWRAVQALRKNERRFQTLADLSPAGIVHTDAAGKLTYANRAWTMLAGVALEDAMADGWAGAVHPDDRDRVVDRWLEAVGDCEDFREEFRFLRPDGSISKVVVQATPERGDDGAIAGYIAVILDITAIAEAHEALAEQTRMFEYLAENASDLVLRLGADGECLYASPAIREFNGLTQQQALSQPIRPLVHPDDREDFDAAWDYIVSGMVERGKVAYRSHHAGGAYNWHEMTARPIRSDTGEVIEVIASVRDIGEHKRMEAALRRARDRAEAAAQAKSAFLANMSHEIRTPMNGVMGFAELLANSDLAEEQQSQAQLILESGRTMMALINDILDLSKIEAGQMSIQAEPVDLQHMICGSIRLMRAAAAQKGLALDAEFAPDLPATVLADKLRIRQVLSNLIGNAVKFTQSGSIDVLVRAEEAEAGTLLAIEVRDTGIGIAPDRIEAIFDEFVQADGSTARRYGGTGLGLAISRRLAGLMNGDLSARSMEGQGSSFTLRFPLVVSAETVAPRDGFEAIAASPAANDHRVLLAEDHDINQMLFSAMLARLGYAVEIAADGAEAVRMVKAAAAAGTPFDIVLMDMQMPEVDGVEATRRIRRAGYDADTLPILALTANAYAEDVEGCLKAGMQDHLTKPVRIETLAARIAHWLGEGRATKQAEAAPAEPDPAEAEPIEPVRTAMPGGLAEKFARRKAETIERISLLARHGALTGEALSEIAELAHKLAGSAGMFGEPALGDRAHELEERAKSLAPGAAASAIDAALEALRAAA